MDAPERPIEIRCAETGEAFDFDPPDDLWADMLAFAEAAGITVAELIEQAVGEFLAQLRREDK